ncbi:alpha,alpha-trehalose-phosphate synthase (UDP-forming) [Rhodopila sp.]|uniref:alpha,alpha-trehalose-phosphate synthase (UDP-forming) n=1 Tax=Rhodopila sp. TaxID=2480087 RepID=UPI003D0E2698
MSRLVVVSNRVPLPSERGAKAGGLAVALADALQPGSLWFGWSGRRSARGGGTTHIQRADSITYATVDLSEADYNSFYVNFANGALWPLLHFRLGLLDFHVEDYAGYRAVNRQFAAALVPLLRPDDLIWVHDYHLIPMAAELRALGVTNRIGFFLHTPFVPPEVFYALPRAPDLLANLCRYDVVGFHTRGYRRAFLDCVAQGLGVHPDSDGRFVWSGRPVRAIIDPVGIDADAFSEQAVKASRGNDARMLRDSLGDKALAIGVDRLDYSKGLSNRFVAIGRFFANYPQHRKQISVLQVAARSREDLGAYQRLRRELDRIVGETNGKYSEFDWTPLRYMTRAVKRDTLAGFFRLARLAIVTPLRDGMNLVAKEYVAAQDPDDPGVLILSRFAGAADELPEALIVNPYDADEIAEAMHHGLSMDLAERRERWRSLHKNVCTNNAHRFCTLFLTHLARADTQPERPSLRAIS